MVLDIMIITIIVPLWFLRAGAARESRTARRLAGTGKITRRSVDVMILKTIKLSSSRRVKNSKGHGVAVLPGSAFIHCLPFHDWPSSVKLLCKRTVIASWKNVAALQAERFLHQPGISPQDKVSLTYLCTRIGGLRTFVCCLLPPGLQSDPTAGQEKQKSASGLDVLIVDPGLPHKF